MNDKRSIRTRLARGYILVLTLGAMAFLSSVLLSIVPTALQSKRQTRNETLRLQGNYVLRAVLQRSLDRFSSDENYTGEVWSLQLPSPPLHPSASPTSGAATNLLGDYQANGEVVIADGELKIQFSLTPVPSSRSAGSQAHSATAAQFPTSAQPNVTIQKTWKLPSDRLALQSQTIPSPSNE